jgi:hypothetical protein
MENEQCTEKTSFWMKIEPWHIILLLIGTFGWFFVTALSHAERLSALEANQDTDRKHIAISLYDMKCALNEIKVDVKLITKSQINDNVKK